LLHQFGGMGVIDFVAVCVTHTRSDVFLTSLNDTTGTDFGSKLASDSVDHHSAEIFSIAVIVNFVSLPRISSVKSSSIFFPTMAWPKGEWMVTTKG